MRPSTHQSCARRFHTFPATHVLFFKGFASLDQHLAHRRDTNNPSPRNSSLLLLSSQTTTPNANTAQHEYLVSIMAQIQELDLGGDISLLVGAEGSQQLRVRASKALLAYASDYFKTLFGPHFSERASAAAGKDIQLADDDPQAFGLLCKILHMRYRSEDPPTYDDLVALGVVADKVSSVSKTHTNPPLELTLLFLSMAACSPCASHSISSFRETSLIYRMRVKPPSLHTCWIGRCFS